MTDRRPPEPPEDDDANWLAAQFDPTGELPKAPPRAPGVPPSRQPVVPPAAVPPAAVPPRHPAVPPAAVPPAAVPPTFGGPAQPQQPVAPPQFPGGARVAPPQFPGARQPTRPPAAQHPTPQQPVVQPQQPVAQPPTTQPPAGQSQPAQPQPAQPQPAQPPLTPSSPAAPSGGGFSWGLTPGAADPANPAAPASPTAAVTPPAATPPAATPPAATPPAAAATPPAATPPAAAHPATPPPQPPGAWFEPIATPIDQAIAGIPHEAQPPAAAQPFETTALADVAPGSRDAPPFWEPEPTQMMDALELEPDSHPNPVAKQPFTRSVFPEGTQLLPESDIAPLPPAPPGETGQVSAIDALFGESQFREYTGVADPSENPFIRRAETAAAADVPGVPGSPGGKGTRPPADVSKLQRILLTVLGSMLGVLLLVALFFVGIRLPGLLAPAPAPTPSASATTPGEPTVAVGPVAPGDYHWDQLLGGECLDPFQSAWQDDFTVVDCATPHAAQLVHIGEFPLPDAGFEAFPGEDELQTRALTLCRAPGIFSSDVSDLKKDAQITVSFTVRAEDWDAGTRNYSCFLSRVSGEPITGDMALPQQAPETDETPSPTGSPTSAP